jgi:hypothetical protein
MLDSDEFLDFCNNSAFFLSSVVGKDFGIMISEEVGVFGGVLG